MDAILTQLRKLPPCGHTRIPHKEITPVLTTMYIKIKSHQLRSNGYPKYHARPQSCMVLVYINHWANKTCELQHATHSRHVFPLRCKTTRIRSTLYFHTMNMLYGVYSVDTAVSDFTTIAFQAEIIIRLATKQEMGWYAHNMHVL